MSTAGAPLVSVITVNLNGERYLERLLRSLERQTYPSVEILVVDNGSTDGSVRLVRGLFPEVQVVETGRNLGFTGGNNLGIREARGSLLALLNNDTVVEPTWLAHLVDELQTDPTIGAVGSKILFARPFLPIAFESAGETPDSCVVFAPSSRFESCGYEKLILSSGVSAPEELDGEPGCRLHEGATVFLPVETLSEPGPLHLRLRGDPASGPCEVRVTVNGTRVGVLAIGPMWRSYRLTVPAETSCRAGFEVINNAASWLRDDGTVGDRGIYEPDRGQYDTPEDVAALCGCSMLVRRSVLEEVGCFDRDYFMYFEDVELSWRIRKAGYRLRFVPRSIVRHFHASTSVEWSPLFSFLVARNRILMLIQHGAPRDVLRAYGKEMLHLLRLLGKHRSLAREPVRTRLRVQLSLLKQAPRAWLKRVGLLRH